MGAGEGEVAVRGVRAVVQRPPAGQGVDGGGGIDGEDAGAESVVAVEPEGAGGEVEAARARVGGTTEREHSGPALGYCAGESDIS